MAKQLAVEFDYAKFTKQGDFMLATGVVLILFVMLVPMPTMVIDLLLTLSSLFWAGNWIVGRGFRAEVPVLFAGPPIGFITAGLLALGGLISARRRR